MLRSYVRQHPLLSFYALAVILGFFATMVRLIDPDAMMIVFSEIMAENQHPNIFTTFPRSLENPVAFSGYLFPAAPSIAAIIIVGIGWGVPGLKNLLARFKPWLNGVSWREGLTIYAVLISIYLSIIALLLIELHLNGTPGAMDKLLDRYSGFSLSIIAFMVIAPFLNHGSLLEELGWRGYMQAEFLQRFSPLKTAVILGLLWGFWHTPRDIPGMILQSDAFLNEHGSIPGFIVNQMIFALGTIASSVCIMYAVNRTGGSVLAAVLVHGMSNELSVGLSLGSGLQYQFFGWTASYQDIVMPTAAILVLIVAGPNLGFRSAPQLPTVNRE